MGVRKLVLAAALAGMAAGAAAQVGEPLPPVRLQDWHGTEARSLTDFFGRALLIEFFAYW